MRRKKKTIHRAAMVNAAGGVSAVCFKRPRSIDLSRSTWTIRDEAVICTKCLGVMRAREAEE